MYIPVTVFGDVGGDGPRDLVSGETLVLVIKDIVPVTLQMVREVGIASLGAQQFERFQIVSSDRPGDVIKDLVGVTSRHFGAHRLLVLGPRGLVIEPPFRALFGPPAPFDSREVRNRIRELYLSRPLRRPFEAEAVTNGYQDQPLAVLRHSISPSINYSLLNCVAERLEFVNDA